MAGEKKIGEVWRKRMLAVMAGLLMLVASGWPQTPAKDRVSLQFRNTAVQDVLKVLATEGGINIVTSKGVQGMVSISVDSLSVMDALSLVVEMQGLAYYRDRGIVKVVTEEEYKSRFGKSFKDRMQTRVRQLRYASADQVVKTIFHLKSKEGNVIADQRSNSVVLIDLPAVLRDMDAVIKQLDIPLQTRNFSLSYVPVQSIEEVVKTIISGGGKVRVDPETNQLMVIDTPERIKRVEAFIEETDLPGEAVMEIFSLQYANAEALVTRLQDELTPGVGTAVADVNTNKVFVKDLPDNLPYLRQLVQTLDQRTRQVLIEAKIIQISLSDNFKMGVNWNAITRELGGDIDVSSQFKILSDNDAGGRIQANGLTSGSYTFNGLIEMLQTVGTTKLLSNPRITCIDGEEAHILVGSTVPYKTIDTRDDKGVLTTFEKVITVEVGVKLNVTPIINDDGFITMKIRPEVSEVTSFIDDIPVVDKSESETTVIVKDGITIVIGGLIKDQKIKTENRVPVLGSIPILGAPFRSRSVVDTKTELVILLRPQIISGDEDMRAENVNWK